MTTATTAWQAREVERGTTRSCNPQTEFRAGFAAGEASIDAAEPERFRALRMIHTEEQFGDCVEDGERFPCKTISILDWVPAEKDND
ncbi:hypothetical protein [Cryobacterium sp. Y57]|uniref:hypothetical protein n=1 Tax=Cryobacterium sp. Y57 TaxID=2048287 RepID=UPI000CE32106|nr:hypothetical protein [Cryobacterium sp. Y57]